MKSTSWLGTYPILLLLSAVAAVVVFNYNASDRNIVKNTVEDKRGEARVKIKNKVTSEESEKLSGEIKWLNKEAGIVQIPVPKALELAPELLKSRQTVKSSKVAVTQMNVLPEGAPILPSAPSGADTIRFNTTGK